MWLFVAAVDVHEWDEFSPDAPDALLFTSSRSQKKTLLSVFEFRLRSSNALGPIHVGCL